MPDRDDSALIWRGRAETRLDHLDSCLDGIRSDLKEIQTDVRALLTWRSQLVGMALAWSVAGSTLVSALVTWLVTRVLR